MFKVFRPGGDGHRARGAPRAARAIAALALVLGAPGPSGASDDLEERFAGEIRPILEDYCFECHGNGIKKGALSLDVAGSDRGRLRDGPYWWAVLKNVRAGLMPPPDKPQPTDAERRLLEDWIKRGAFGIDPTNPDPGRVTVRRLNRVEYRNTIRDLMGVDYDTTAEFPPDDSGHGFDNIADVLTLSPLLLEKYLDAAKAILSRTVPTVPWVVAEAKIPGRRFHRDGPPVEGDPGPDGPLALSYYEPATVSSTFLAGHGGDYQLVLDLAACERGGTVFDANRCRVVLKADGREVFREEYGRQADKPLRYRLDVAWGEGPRELTFALEPLTPGERQLRSLNLRIDSVTVRGPLDRKFWIRPANHSRHFPGAVPEDAPGRRAYARSLIRDFARKAFRRPADDATLDRLVALAEREYNRRGQTFEGGISQAMAAVLASPRFLYREEGPEPGSPDPFPLLDEYALASRLSYFFWSSMPDPELSRLAGEGKLREDLPAQVKRMLADPKSGEFIRHFVGQWMQARDVETVPINAFAVIQHDQPTDPGSERGQARLNELGRRFPESLADGEKKERDRARAAFFSSFRRFKDYELNDPLRQAMRRETEMLVERVVREDRSLRDLLVGDYTYLNERLARHYGIAGVEGDEMRLVSLPPGSPRGGVLTQGTVLAVTSNPDRTSPVKRGLFILDNILGIPPPPPPPNIPALEEASKEFAGRTPTLREALELHRGKPACSSCHNRMDPLGLALENFDALGRWREREQGNPVNPTGKLITGESFTGIRELKEILADRHSRDFYRCLSEKLMTYALGRGLDHRDVGTVDELVDRLERENGRAGALIDGIVNSAQFQRRRRPPSGKPSG